MRINELLKAIGNITNDSNVKTYDLTTKKGYKEFCNAINELKESDNSLFELLGIDFDELIDNLSELGKNIYECNNKEDLPNTQKDIVKNSVKQMERKEEDHSEENLEEDENPKEFKRPSELLSVDQKLQLHKLVQEYVDTTIKPFNKGILSNDQINDAYAGLYEFGAWVLNK